jgi:hypothetical protein
LAEKSVFTAQTQRNAKKKGSEEAGGGDVVERRGGYGEWVGESAAPHGSAGAGADEFANCGNYMEGKSEKQRLKLFLNQRNKNLGMGDRSLAIGGSETGAEARAHNGGFRWVRRGVRWKASGL